MKIVVQIELEAQLKPDGPVVGGFREGVWYARTDWGSLVATGRTVNEVRTRVRDHFKLLGHNVKSVQTESQTE